MGIYDREYYRDDSPQGFEWRSGWSTTTWLIVINAGVFLLNALVGQHNRVMEMIQATPATLVKPYLWWQLITYGFGHDPNGIAHILWNMFALWVFGKPIEGIYGPKEFLRFYLAAIFLGGLFWTARVGIMFMGMHPQGWEALQHVRFGLLGASGAVTAVTLLFCIHYPKQTILLMMVLPVPAWFVGAMIILGNVFGSLVSSAAIAFDVHLVGAVFAICYYKFGWNLGRWQPDLSFISRLISRRPKLRVHQPLDPDIDEQLASQADELLEKINQQGIDSLTAKERRILEQHSRRVRDKHR